MRRAAITLVALLASAVASACSSEDAPTPTTTATPNASGSVAQSIVTSDGVRLAARLFEAESDGRLALLSHQYTGDQSGWYDAARRLQASGLSALTFDFRGFGESGGEEDPETLPADLDAAIAYARGQGYDRIALIGASMGGTASILIAAEEGAEVASVLDGVIALSAPIAFGAVRVEDAAASMPVPLLLVAAEGDTSAFDSLARIGDAAGVPDSQRVVVAGMAHGAALLDGEDGNAVWAAITRMLETIWASTAGAADASAGQDLTGY